MLAQEKTPQPAGREQEKGDTLQVHKNVFLKRQRDADEDILFEAVYRVLDKIEDRARAARVKHIPAAKNELCSVM
jgi:hypothetical protein